MSPLIDQLRQIGVLQSPPIERALEEIDRADFAPENLKSLAYEDNALPIGEGQTISQPYTVVFMLEHLQTHPGDTVLEIGYGSGWQAALLAHLVGSKGRVYAFEIVPFLCTQGVSNLRKYPHLTQRVHCFCRSGEEGCIEAAPFDKIIAAAEVVDVPTAWREQLKLGGRMIYPKDNALVMEVKNQDGSFETTVFPGFVFVPFVKA